MSKIKFIFSLTVALFMLISISVIAAGCAKKEKITGKFYTLQEAYEQDLLTKDDLRVIAGYHNAEKQYSERLNGEIAETIKRDWTKDIEEKFNEHIEKIDGETALIKKYYGSYNGCVAVIIECVNVQNPAVYNQIVVDVGGISFNYNDPGPRIMVWVS